jgi:hypothetical protein
LDFDLHGTAPHPRTRRTSLLLLFGCIAFSWSHFSEQLSAVEDDPGGRVRLVGQWLNAVLQHRPGTEDEAFVEVRSWSNGQLGMLGIDEGILVQLMRDPKVAQFRVATNPTQSPGRRSGGQPTPPPLIPYTRWQLHRLKVLACAAAGIVTEPPCLDMNASASLDADLRRLADVAFASRLHGDQSYVLRRGALLHTDVALSGPDRIEHVSSATPASAQRLWVIASDGSERGRRLDGIHWEMARLLLGAVRPGNDAMVRLWYRATAAWMQSQKRYDTVHLNRARALFPNDADLFFLSGCQRETYAGPAIQALVLGTVLPSDVEFGIGSDRKELREAETFFRHALTLNPMLVEGRLRLGRVLLLRGRPKEAALELRQAMASADDVLMSYFGALFLGAAEEALGDFEGAHRSYTEAEALYPRAQSPYLALSALARRRGDRADALEKIQRVFDLWTAESEGDDPWWGYHTAQARNANTLLEQLRQPFLESPQ